MGKESKIEITENTDLFEKEENEKLESSKTSQQKAATNSQLKASGKVDDPLESIFNKISDMNPQERINAGKSYLNIQNQEDGLIVSPESGSLQLENTDFVIYGKNDFEFPIKRIYDSSTAKQDIPSIISFISNLSDTNFTFYDMVDLLSYLGVNIDYGQIRYSPNNSIRKITELLKDAFLRRGGYAVNLGAGWKLNLPYIVNIPSVVKDVSNPEKNKKIMMIRMPGGSYYQLDAMKRTFEEYHSNIDTYKYENHQREDFTLFYT
nr:hypothetical protein [Treponema sp.]